MTTFTDEGLNVDQEYCYFLTALNDDGEPGEPSEPVCATPRHYIQLSGRALTSEAPSVVHLTFAARDQDAAPVTDLPATAFVLAEDGVDLDPDPVVGPGIEGWNRYHAIEATVVMDGTAYAMWVVHREGLTQRLGYYTSWDGITWRAGTPEPVFEPAGGEAWDAAQVGAPAAHAFEDQVRLWYSGNAIGSSSGSGWRVCVASYTPTPEIEYFRIIL